LVVPDINQQSLLTGRVRVMQALIAAMAIGVLAFLVAAFVLHTKIEAINKAHNLGIVTHIALAVGVVALVGGPFLAGALVNAGRRRLAAGAKAARPSTAKATGFEDDLTGAEAVQLSSLLVSRTIINAAIYEGAAMLLCVAFLLNHNLLTAVCSVFLVVALLMQMPTKGRAQRWIEDQLRQLQQEQSVSR
jgi:hypothetical protein